MTETDLLMKTFKIILLLLMPLMVSAQFNPAYHGDYFVAPWGNDSNNGQDTAHSFATWQKAFNTADAGDTVYYRGGVYYPQNQLAGLSTATAIAPRTVQGVYTGTVYGNSGTAGNLICHFAYPNEYPILDCSQVDTAGHKYNTGVSMYLAEYINFRGLKVRNVYQTQPNNDPLDLEAKVATGWGMYVCANLTFENITVHDIGGRGFSGSFTAGSFGIETDTTRFINCDLYNLNDHLSSTPGNAADGYKMDSEPGGYYIFSFGRSWNCTDDGIDMSGSGITVYNNCWSFLNGNTGSVDGNGFKSGAVRDSITEPSRLVNNCISAYNRGIGFYDLEYAIYYRTNARYSNNISFYNGIGISIPNNAVHNPGRSLSFYRNNIVYGTRQTDAGGRPYHLDVVDIYQESHNTWDYGEAGSLPNWIPTDTVTVTNVDFQVTDSATIINQLKAPRKADGSLPDITAFRLAIGSDLIGAGTNVGMSATPDIGIDWAYLDAQSEPDSTANDITGFAISGQTGSSTINFTNHTVGITMPYGTDVTNLTPTISVSSGAIISPTSGTARNFTSPQTYTVTALDGETEQVWTVTVTVDSAPTPSTGRKVTRGSNGRVMVSGNGHIIYVL